MNKTLLTIGVCLCVGLFGWFTQCQEAFWCLMGLVLWLICLHFRTWHSWGWLMVVSICVCLQLYRLESVSRLPLGELVNDQLEVNPNHIKINGDSVTGIAVLKQEKLTEKVFFTYRLSSEEEKVSWDRIDDLRIFQVSGKMEAFEGARNRGGFNAKVYYQSQGVTQKFVISSMRALKISKGYGSFLVKWRSRLLHLVEKQSPSLVRDYTLLLLFGTRREVEQETLEPYKQVGLMHLLAISGLHMTIFVEVLEKLFWRIGVSREWTNVWVCACLLVFGWLMDWNVSGTRAILMVVLGMLGHYFSFSFKSFDRLVFVALGAICWQPTVVLSISFQLSYGMTALVLLTSKWSRKSGLAEWQQRLVIPILVPLLGLPVICQYFFVWNIWSILLAGAIVLMFKWLIIPGVLLYGFGCLCGGRMLSELLSIVLEWLHRVLYFFAQLPVGQITLGQWRWWQWLLYWGLACLLAIVVEKRNRHYLLTTGIIAAMGIVIASVPFHFHYELIVLDIGQGDAILIKEPGWNHAILVDTGGEVSFSSQEKWRKRQTISQAKKTLIPALQAEGLSRLDAILLTHNDYDHVGNLDELLKEKLTQQLIVANGMQHLQRMQSIARDYPNLQWKMVKAGEHWTHWSFLAPGHLSKGENDDSIVALYKAKGYTALLTGDASSSVEEHILNRFPSIQVDFLKVGHHGSQTATSEMLLLKTRPKAAMISAGKNNRYQHPHPQTLERLANYHITTFSTKEDGAIRIRLSENQFLIQTTLTKRKLVKR